MTERKIQLETIDKIKDFVQIVTKYDCDIDLASERYIVDAKSIMGVFSMNLSKPLDLRIHNNGTADIDGLLQELSLYIID